MRAERANIDDLRRVPSARAIARLMTSSRDALSRTETVVVATIENAAPALVEARDIVDAFHKMLRQKTVAALNPWIETARESPLWMAPTLQEKFDDLALVGSSLLSGLSMQSV